MHSILLVLGPVLVGKYRSAAIGCCALGSRRKKLQKGVAGAHVPVHKKVQSPTRHRNSYYVATPATSTNGELFQPTAIALHIPTTT